MSKSNIESTKKKEKGIQGEELGGGGKVKGLLNSGEEAKAGEANWG